MEDSFDKPLERNFNEYVMMAGFYIKHNTSIGLQCFALGPLILPSLCALGYNAVVLGASFGYMARSDVEQGDVFFQFVTAHGVFELTAIALSAASGLRLGIGLFATGGLRREESFRLNAERALPIIMAAVVLFFLAAFTEGFISPSPLPYVFQSLCCHFEFRHADVLLCRARLPSPRYRSRTRAQRRQPVAKNRSRPCNSIKPRS